MYGVEPTLTALIDEQPGEWHEPDHPLHERGVRLTWLLRFTEAIYEPRLRDYESEVKAYQQALKQNEAAKWLNYVPYIDAVEPKEPLLSDFTTRRLVADYVLPITQSIGAPLYALVPASDRGKPTCFLSHAWDAPIKSPIARFGAGTLDAFTRGVASVRDEFVWIDIVCYNQHRLVDNRVAFDMDDLIRSIGKVAFAVTPTLLFDRMWCLWEVICLARNRASAKFCVHAGYRTDTRVMTNEFFESFTSIKDAKTTKREDYDHLMQAVIAQFGTVDAADQFLKKLMADGMANPWYGLYDTNRILP